MYLGIIYATLNEEKLVVTQLTYAFSCENLPEHSHTWDNTMPNAFTKEDMNIDTVVISQEDMKLSSMIST